MEPPDGAWLSALRRYFCIIVVGNLVWEFAQLPLYTLWRTGSTAAIAFAAIHCTAGDVLIAGAALVGSLLLFGAADWPRSCFLSVAGVTVFLGVAYTIYSEYLNTARNAWTYSELMPVLPGLGTGLAPLTQWIVVPALAFGAMRSAAWSKIRVHTANKRLDLPTMGGSGSGKSAHSPGGCHERP